MTLKYKLTSVTFSNGDQISFDQDSTILIVGPNNSGKSCFLREIFNVIENGDSQTQGVRKVTKNIQFSSEGNEKDFMEYLEQNTQRYLKPDGQSFMRALKFDVHENTAMSRWNNLSNGFHESSSLICTYADTLSRLTIANPPTSINFLVETPQHPIHVLHQNDKLEEKISSYLQEAFGDELILNRGAGSVLPLHIGKNPTKENSEDRVSSSYLKKLSELPLTNEQGDGIRSFVGCLLSTVVMPRFITLLDEPEAFLHPPQARHLGSLLANEHTNNQLILATHSGDILRGILDTNSKNLNILRITRKANKNSAFKLNSDDLKLFWSDPILRFSNILDALFHEAAIICESDTDCRFYSSVMTAIYDGPLYKNKRKPDLFFTSSGGKNRIATIAKALVKIKLETRVIVDFDLLFEKERTKELYEILGGNWHTVNADYDIVKAGIESQSTPIPIIEICNAINSILEQVKKSNQFSEQNKESIRSHIKSSNSLRRAKREGINILPEDKKEAFNNLLLNFKKHGLWLVPFGELESFDMSTTGHGTTWVAKVLEKNIISSNELKNARDFITELSGLNNSE